LIQCGIVKVMAVTLVDHRDVPVQAEGVQRMQDVIGGAGLFPRRVQVFNADKPAAPAGTNINITGQRGQQGAEMQGASRRGRETSDRAHGMGRQQDGVRRHPGSRR